MILGRWSWVLLEDRSSWLFMSCLTCRGLIIIHASGLGRKSNVNKFGWFALKFPPPRKMDFCFRGDGNTQVWEQDWFGKTMQVRQEFVKRNSWWGENLRLAANAITLTNRLWLFLRRVDHIGPRHSEIRLRYFDYLGWLYLYDGWAWNSAEQVG